MHVEADVGAGTFAREHEEEGIPNCEGWGKGEGKGWGKGEGKGEGRDEGRGDG